MTSLWRHSQLTYYDLGPNFLTQGVALLAGEVSKVSKQNSQYFRSYLRKTTGGPFAPPPSGARVNHWTHLTHCRFLVDMTSRVSIYRMCCKCYRLSALAAVDGNSTFLNFTLKVARRNGVNCNKQLSMVIIMLFFLRQVRRVIGLEYAAR